MPPTLELPQGLGSFLPKLQEYIAEFLSESYLEHLSILYWPTCVGLRYGQNVLNLETISWKFGVACYIHPKVDSLRSSSQTPDFPRALKDYNQKLGRPTPSTDYPSPSFHRTNILVQEYEPASHRLRSSASS